MRPSTGESSSSSVMLSEESYFSFFFSNRQTQQIAAAKYVCNLAFILFLGIKLQTGGGPWAWVLFPLFLSNIITCIVAVQEIHSLLPIVDSYFRLIRQVATLVDLIGSFCAKVAFCVILDVKSGHSSSWTTLLSPLWVCIVLSSILRCFHCSPRSLPAALRTRHRVATIVTMIGYLLQRGLQPLLVTMRYDGLISTNWSIVAAPTWLLIFFGLGCTLLLVSFAPFVHSNSNADLRKVAHRLIYVLATQLAAISVCSLFFLVLCTQKMDFNDNSGTDTEDGGSDVSNHDFTRVLLPLVVMFVALLALNPILLNISNAYQEQLSAVMLQRLSRPHPHHPHNNNTMSIAKTERLTWLLYHTQGNVYSVIDSKDVNQLLGSSSRGKQFATREEESYCVAEDRVHDHLDALHFNPLQLAKSSSESVTTSGAGDIELGVISAQAFPRPGTVAYNTAPPENLVATTTADTMFDAASTNPCVVCLSRPINTVLMTCGHAVTCLHCVLTLGKQVNTAHCPVCRRDISFLYHLQQPPFDVATSASVAASALSPPSAFPHASVSQDNSDALTSCSSTDSHHTHSHSLHQNTPPQVAVEKTDHESATTSTATTTASTSSAVTTVRLAVASREYHFLLLRPLPGEVYIGAPSSSGYMAVQQSGDMSIHNGTTGHMVQVPASSNTIAYHDSLLDVLF